MTDPDQFGERHFPGESPNPEIARVDLEDQGRSLSHGPLVIAPVRPVRGSHFPEDGAAFFHDLGNAELSADLDELAPGNHRLPSFRQRVQDEKNGGGVVVHHEGVLRPREGAQKGADVVVPETPLPLSQIVFQVRISLGRLHEPGQGLPGEGRSPQVRVQDDSRGVHHHAKARPAEQVEPLQDSPGGRFHRRNGGRRPFFPEPVPRFLDLFPDHADHVFPGNLPGETRLLDKMDDLVDLGKISQQRVQVLRHFPSPDSCPVELPPARLRQNERKLFTAVKNSRMITTQ